ncbi:hypothetical protein D917_04215 [Trichinella nativa]|uniref:Uncharacterized protein n=1 Tax=Trichinella nativa TaxID=6335 RepID=A0A1Y3E5D4_9BILA|nr:hypothetical protein D917_04215 [Trichinella nativa]
MNKEKICGFPVIRLPNSKSQEATASPLDKRSHQTDLLKKFMSAMSSESTKKSTLLVHKPAPKITLLGKPTIAVPDEACKQRSPDAKALTSPGERECTTDDYYYCYYFVHLSPIFSAQGSELQLSAVAGVLVH